MEIFKETDRLILRELVLDDVQGIWELDSDPEVHRYLGNNPVKDIGQCEEFIEFVRQQYLENGIGRWAVIEKISNKFVGVAGLKFVTEQVNRHRNYYDLGYRFIRSFWGKGFAAEASSALLEYGFEELNLNVIVAITDSRNLRSINVLNKLGFQSKEKFFFNTIEHDWFEIIKEDWINGSGVNRTDTF